MRKRPGFTLIELLVVIAILGLLSTIITVAMGQARLKARDSKRMADLKQIQTALELYYTDQNSYPAGSAAQLGTGNYACLTRIGFLPLSSGCADAYMGSVPTDPNRNVYYIYTVASGTYSVATQLEGNVNGLTGNIQLTPSGIGPRP